MDFNPCMKHKVIRKTVRGFAETELGPIAHEIDRDARFPWEVIDKIKGQPSQEFEAMFPAKQPSRVVVKTKDGREFSEYLEYPKGDPREPMTMDDLENKFNALAGELLSKERQNEIKEMIFSCDEISCKEFMGKLVI